MWTWRLSWRQTLGINFLWILLKEQIINLQKTNESLYLLPMHQMLDKKYFLFFVISQFSLIQKCKQMSSFCQYSIAQLLLLRATLHTFYTYREYSTLLQTHLPCSLHDENLHQTWTYARLEYIRIFANIQECYVLYIYSCICHYIIIPKLETR